MDPSTVAVSAGRGQGRPGESVNAPVQFTSIFHAGGEIGYARDGNPTWDAFEAALGALESGTALAFASGMAATAAVFDMCAAGTSVSMPAGGYYKSRSLVEDLAERRRIVIGEPDTADLVWIESPANPTLEVVDIAAVAAAAHERGALVAVDNTFATPLRQKPLELGADIVVHSVTKLLAGHSDIVMGAVVARDGAIVDALRQQRSLHGAVPGPMETFLALRGIRTLAVRLDRAEASARVIADRLATHHEVGLVRYPGFGTMIAFDVDRGAAAADAVCEAVDLIVHATSLGGVESLIERRGKWAGEEMTPPELLRLSVGIEHVEDLWADLAQALDSVADA